MQPKLAQFPLIRFAPVQLKARHDGWTPERQLRFIAELAATRSVTRACNAVGMSRASAYALRDRHKACPEPGRGAAAGFALAWRVALSPDVSAERRHSPRALRRLRRLAARRLRKESMERSKVDEAHETHDPPDSFIPRPPDRQPCHL